MDQMQGLSQSFLFVLFVFLVGFLVELSDIINNLQTHNTHVTRSPGRKMTRVAHCEACASALYKQEVK